MSYLGDYAVGSTIDLFFTTQVNGVPTTLAGSPAVSVYKGNDTTQSVAGVTLTVDFDGRTGLNQIRITTATDATFYATANDFTLVITAGTLGGISAVGYVVDSFSLENRAALRPTTAGRTLDVAATGEAGVDLSNVKDGAMPAYSVAAPATLPTWAQIMYMIWQAQSDFSIAGTTITGKDLNGNASMTWTLDSPTAPTSRIRAT